MMMSSSVSKVRSGLTVVLAVAGLAGCGGKTESGAKTTPPVKKPNGQLNSKSIQLIDADLADLKTRSHDGAAAYDASHGRIFTKVFGGTSPAHVMNYINTRISYYVDPEDSTADIIPSDLLRQPWLGNFMNDIAGGPKVGAANYGVLYWLASIVRGSEATFTLGSSRIPVKSSRVGIMVVGEGYSEREVTARGSIDIPREFRQMILVHEARHSDCTGGVTQDDLAKLRASTGKYTTNEIMKTFRCGHLHVICPEGHDYAGYAACDNETWGAYGVGASFYDAMLADANNPTLKQFESRAVQSIDLASRTLVTAAGDPDMSSDGVR